MNRLTWIVLIVAIVIIVSIVVFYNRKPKVKKSLSPIPSDDGSGDIDTPILPTEEPIEYGNDAPESNING